VRWTACMLTVGPTFVMSSMPLSVGKWYDAAVVTTEAPESGRHSSTPGLQI